MKAGIAEPFKITCSALQNAAAEAAGGRRSGGATGDYGSWCQPVGMTSEQYGSMAVATMPSLDEIEAAAERVLQRTGIDAPPVNPTRVAEALGYQVRAALFRDPDLSGCVSVQDGVTLIEVSALDGAARRRFTIAHEIGHAQLHLRDARTGAFTDTPRHQRLASIAPGADPSEVNANQFAAALLMPRDWVEQAFARDRDVATLARRFHVSLDAMTFRLKNLSLA
jgi:Zn-dependent peptidase ImmA (M78 family)